MNKSLLLIVTFFTAPSSILTMDKQHNAPLNNLQINIMTPKTVSTKKRKLEDIEQKENELQAYYNSFDNYKLTTELKSIETEVIPYQRELIMRNPFMRNPSKKPRLTAQSSNVTVKTSSAAYKITPPQTPNKKSSASIHQATPMHTNKRKLNAPAKDSVLLANLVNDKSRTKKNYAAIRNLLQDNQYSISSKSASQEAKKDKYNHELRSFSVGRVLINAMEGKEATFNVDGTILTPADIDFPSHIDKALLLAKAKKLHTDATKNNSSKK